jgi:hypothetical protein
MLGTALRVSATVARGSAERVAKRSGYGAQERVKKVWCSLRACASTHGHTLCAAVLTTQSHQILCGKYPPGHASRPSRPRLAHCAVGKVRRAKEKLAASRKVTTPAASPPLGNAASVAGESNGSGRVPRRGLFNGKDGF